MTDAIVEVVEEEVDTADAAIQEAFDTSVSNEVDEDDTKMAMIMAGATFKNVTRLYNKFMIVAGLAISKEDRNQIVEDALEGVSFDTAETFEAASKALFNSITGITERSADALVRNYAKKKEVECYAKPAENGTRNPFVSIFHSSLVENPEMTHEELVAIIDNLAPDHQTNPRRWINQHDGIRKICNGIAAKYTVVAA